MTQKIKFTNDKKPQILNEGEVSQRTTRESVQTILKNIYPSKVLFSIQEVAEILGMSYDYIAKQIRIGNIEAVRFGDRPLVNIEVLSQLVLTGIQNG